MTRTLPETVVSIADAAFDAVVVVDAKLNVIHANRAFARLVGIRERELRQQRQGICHGMLGLESCKEGCVSLKVFASGKPQRLHEVKAGRDGLVVIQSVVPLIADGKIYAVMETYRDVTAEARMQSRYRELLEEEQKRSEALVREVQLRETQLDSSKKELEDVRSQLLGIFREEVQDAYVRMTADVIALGHASGDAAEKIGERVMRDAHTLKGTAGSIGLGEISTLAHAFETAFTRGMDGPLPLTRDLVDRLLLALDEVDTYLDALVGGASDSGAGLLRAARVLEEGESGSQPRALRIFNPDTYRVKTTQLETIGNELEELMHDLLSTNVPEALQSRFSRLQRRLHDLSVVSISSLLEPFRRSVWDHARKLGRDAILEIRGGNITLDRSLVEGLRGPLTHLVRNAVDHGIELPETRRGKGKPPIGRIFIDVVEIDGHISITVEDDGNGVNLERVREIAVAQGNMDVKSESELMEMIWRPRFSTAPEITETAGRGVGLDAVRDAVARLWGDIAVQSSAGLGTRFTIRVPRVREAAAGRAGAR